MAMSNVTLTDCWNMNEFNVLCSCKWEDFSLADGAIHKKSLIWGSWGSTKSLEEFCPHLNCNTVAKLQCMGTWEVSSWRIQGRITRGEEENWESTFSQQLWDMERKSQTKTKRTEGWCMRLMALSTSHTGLFCSFSENIICHLKHTDLFHPFFSCLWNCTL